MNVLLIDGISYLYLDFNNCFFFFNLSSEASGHGTPGSKMDLAGLEESIRQTSHPQHHIPLPGRPAGLRRSSLHLWHRPPHQQGQPHHSAAGETLLCLIVTNVLIAKNLHVAPIKSLTLNKQIHLIRTMSVWFDHI